IEHLDVELGPRLGDIQNPSRGLVAKAILASAADDDLDVQLAHQRPFFDRKSFTDRGGASLAIPVDCNNGDAGAGRDVMERLRAGERGRARGDAPRRWRWRCGWRWRWRCRWRWRWRCLWRCLWRDSEGDT